LRHARGQHRGAISLGADPFSQWSCQKLVFSPLPTVTCVHARNQSYLILVDSVCSPIHGLLSLVHLFHIHRSCSVRPKFFRSCIPSPPNFFGRHTLLRFTWQLPPLALSSPFHRKFLRIRSIRLIAHLDSGSTEI
jgi:hypothetical protein